MTDFEWNLEEDLERILLQNLEQNGLLWPQTLVKIEEEIDNTITSFQVNINDLASEISLWETLFSDIHIKNLQISEENKLKEFLSVFISPQLKFVL